MSIGPGQPLLHYRIVEKLGEGGMGVVWKARDTTLEREVAIKVLPEAFATDRERLARFEREARLLASVNHPNIAAVYGLHETDTPAGPVHFIAMELVEGDDLAARLARGPLAVEDALEVAAQIADGFAVAHDQGVIHRDLKPANVVRNAEGKIKILDFGLAKMFAPEAASGPANLSRSPTVTSAGTVAGTLLGTAAYMSPEQARGKAVDRRADVWAFGCVLYEMLTGRQAFSGETITDVLAAIVHREPDWQRLPAQTPAGVRRLLQRCLRKDLRGRVRDMGDLRVLLEDARATLGSGELIPDTAGPSPVVPLRGWPWPAVAGVLAVALIAALVVIVGPFGEPPAPAGPQRYVLATADLQPSSTPVLAPDGNYVVFSVREGTSRRLYRRELASFGTTPIAGTEDGADPFFSPDGAWIGFFTFDAIKRVPASGGVAQVITVTPRASSGEWGRNGEIYFTYRSGGPDGLAALMRVPATGGTAEPVAALERETGEIESWLPEILPDGKTVLVSILGAAAPKIVAIGADGSRHTVVEGGFLARYARPGYLLYLDNASQAVVAAPFDASSARVTGAAVALTEGVDGSFCYDVSPDGKLVYVPLPGAGEGDEVVWLDRMGSSTPAMDVRSQWAQPRVSPDGKHVLLRKIGTNCELWLLDVERGSLARVVHDHDAHDPLWAPDGRRVAYHQLDTGAMVTQTVVGVREVETLAQGEAAGAPHSWSARGNLLAYVVSGRSTRDDIWVLAADGSSAPEPFVATEFNENAPAFSPDGKWVAYVSDESGTAEVFVRSYPDRGDSWQLSTGGGRSPVWSLDGRELFFVLDDKMMSVPVETQPGFSAGTAVELFEADLGTGRTRDFDPAPDGRFVSLRRVGGERGRQELRVLLSWQQEMRRTAGAGPR